jgi:hypothetical protein
MSLAAYINSLINSCKTVLIAELCDVICYVIAHDLRCQHGNIIGNIIGNTNGNTNGNISTARIFRVFMLLFSGSIYIASDITIYKSITI